MARIIYALSGQGRGHSSRVRAVSSELRNRGHEIFFCGGGTALEVLQSQGDTVIPVPHLRQIVHDNRVRMLKTVSSNLTNIRNLGSIVDNLADAFVDIDADLLITDFEAFSPRAAERIGLPTLSFNHQQVVTETRYRLSPRHRINAALASTVIKLVVPDNPVHTLLTSFYFPEVRDPDNVSLIGPILRPEIRSLHTQSDNFTLVYFNQAEGSDSFAEVLSRSKGYFVVYNFPKEARLPSPNIEYKDASCDGFLNDLAKCSRVICTAGFTLLSESLFLGKPVLCIPNRGIFEQTLNAIFLEKSGLGVGIIDRPATVRDIDNFLRTDFSRASARHSIKCGNRAAVSCIERYTTAKRTRPRRRSESISVVEQSERVAD